MEQTILTKDQRAVLDYIATQESMRQFYLSGGTALSEYYFHHRLSEDLDFFTDQKIDMLTVSRVVKEIKDLLDAKKVTSRRIFDRNLYFFDCGEKELKLEFTYYPFKQLEKSTELKNMRVDSLRDISANKLMALIDRLDPKDFVDMYYILEKRNLKDIVKDVQKKFGLSISDLQICVEFAKIKAVTALPKLKKKLTLLQLKDFFVQQARTLSKLLIS